MRIVISMGLMLDVNYIRCITSFNNILEEQGHRKAGMDTWKAMMPAILQVDDQFKEGNIDALEFQTQIERIVSQQTGQSVKLTLEEFTTMWNEMIRDGSSKFKRIFQSLIDAGHTPILISGINSIHFACLQGFMDNCLVLQPSVVETVQEEKTYSVYASYAYQKTKLELYDIILKDYGNDDMFFIMSSTQHIQIPEVKAREDNLNAQLITYANEKYVPVIEMDPAENIVEQIEQGINKIANQRQIDCYQSCMGINNSM